jgi:saccharopepsin
VSLQSTWHNQLGSRMVLTVNGNQITGTYETSVGSAKGPYPLVGRTTSDGQSGQTLGFTVSWQNGSGNSDATTSWSGQLRFSGGNEWIQTTWLLTTQMDLASQWKSTVVGQDFFTRDAGVSNASAGVGGPPSHPRSAE